MALQDDAGLSRLLSSDAVNSLNLPQTATRLPLRECVYQGATAASVALRVYPDGSIQALARTGPFPSYRVPVDRLAVVSPNDFGKCALWLRRQTHQMSRPLGRVVS
jgi:hypothetical protein